MAEVIKRIRVVQESVPGKQITLANIIPNPDEAVCTRVGVPTDCGAIGIMTITPIEAAIIAADLACKAGDVTLAYMDRFNGALIITGDVAAVETGVQNVMHYFCDQQGYSSVPITRT